MQLSKKVHINSWNEITCKDCAITYDVPSKCTEDLYCSSCKAMLLRHDIQKTKSALISISIITFSFLFLIYLINSIPSSEPPKTKENSDITKEDKIKAMERAHRTAAQFVLQAEGTIYENVVNEAYDEMSMALRLKDKDAFMRAAEKMKKIVNNSTK